jgi:hypothetical protein
MNGALIFHPDSILVNPLPPQISMTRFSVLAKTGISARQLKNTKHILSIMEGKFFHH